MKNKKKLKGKDLINIGIYAAIYCVIMTAVAMLGFIPIMMYLSWFGYCSVCTSTY